MENFAFVIACNLLAHFLRQTDGCYITAKLTGGIIENSQGDDFEIIEFFTYLRMHTFTELIYIYARVLQRNVYKRTLTIFLLKSVMHSQGHCRLNHDASSGTLIHFPAIYSEMRIAISTCQVIDCMTNLIARHE